MLVYPLHVLCTNRILNTMISRNRTNKTNSGTKGSIIKDFTNIHRLSGVFIGLVPYTLAYFGSMQYTNYKKIDGLFIK